jgi:hypothetical protein
MMKGSHPYSFTIEGDHRSTMNLLSLPRHHPNEVKIEETLVGSDGYWLTLSSVSTSSSTRRP